MKQAILTHKNFAPNESIKNGDVFHRIYEVSSDPVVTGDGAVWKVRHRRWNVDLTMTRPDPRLLEQMSETEQKQFISVFHYIIHFFGVHPLIAGFFDVRHIQGGTALFTEWSPNGTLRDVINNGSLYESIPQEIDERLYRIAVQTARAAQYIASKSALRPVITPETILITADWNARLSLSCLSVLTDPLGSGRDVIGDWAITVLEMYTGKPLWNSPEEAAADFFDYVPRFRAAMPEKLQRVVCAALTHFLPDLPNLIHDYDHLFHELGLQLGAEYPDERGGVCNNFALRLIDNGRWEQAFDVFEDAAQKETSGVNPAAANLALLNQYLSYSGCPLAEMPEDFFSAPFQLYQV